MVDEWWAVFALKDNGTAVQLSRPNTRKRSELLIESFRERIEGYEFELRQVKMSSSIGNLQYCRVGYE